MFRNPFRDRRKFKLGWRESYPSIQINEPQANAEGDKFPGNEISTTKYSAFSYLPKVLFQEFKKFTSVYFLIVAIITLIPQVSPFSPWTSVGGLLFILAVSMVREAVEDVLRLRADAKVNRATFSVIPPGFPLPLSRSSFHSNANLNHLKNQTQNQTQTQHHNQNHNNYHSNQNHEHDVQDLIVNSIPNDQSPLLDSDSHSDAHSHSHSQSHSQNNPIPSSSSSSSTPHGSMEFSHDAFAFDPLHVACAELRVGDLVYLQCDEFVPADLLLLSSGEPDSVCYLETAQLDGETNLKLRRAPLLTQQLPPAALASLRGTLHVNGVPDVPLYQFEATLHLQPQCLRPDFLPPSMIIHSSSSSTSNPLLSSYQSDQILELESSSSISNTSSTSSFNNTNNNNNMTGLPLDGSAMLPRGCRLRNTPWVCGMVVFAGTETKLMLNARDPPSKFSSLDFRINKYVLWIFVFQLVLCVWMAGITVFFQHNGASNAWYLGSLAEVHPAVAGVENFFAYFALMSYLIPISLVVTVEIAKVIQGMFMEWDVEMMAYDEAAGAWEGMTVKTFNLNDDLGTVRYVFSDKTGTLTRNQMLFMKCAVLGVDVFHAAAAGQVFHRLHAAPQHSQQRLLLHRFLLVLSLCHSCVASGGLPIPLPSDHEKSTPSSSLSSPAVAKKAISSTLKKIAASSPFSRKKKHDANDPHPHSPSSSSPSSPHASHDHYGAQQDDASPPQPLRYRSASPDEEALCVGASKNQYVFRGRQASYSLLEILGVTHRYQVLFEMPFTSERRRMSCIVREPDGTVLLLSKGADVEMLSRLESSNHNNNNNNDPLSSSSSSTSSSISIQTLQQQLELFSAEGLRTLVLCYRVLSEEELAAFSQRHYAASVAATEREQAVERVNDGIERGLVPLGCTAIEDRLQDQVPESISYLQQAGIKLWVITGDKQATAVNIGYATRLLSPAMALEAVNAASSAECLLRLQELVARHLPPEGGGAFEVPERELALVIDGASLAFCLRDHAELLYRLAEASRSVICCRVSPLQKAEVVRLVKDRTADICLAIGDGANDVGMIQEAHIGIGIFGREGSEAARSSDYALREFKHLRRLLCVHGRYALIRNAGLSLYSLYKNAAIFLSQIWFSFFSVASAQTLYDEWIMTFFNIIFTSWPPLIYGCLEKDIDERIIELYPETYARTQQNRVFTLWKLTEWMLFATWHSVVLYFGTMALISWPATVMSNGQTFGLTTFGNMVMTTGIIVIFLKLIMETLEWNWIVHLSMWGSIALYFILVIMETVWVPVFISQYWVFFNLVQYTPSFWLWFIAAIMAALLPDFLLLIVRTYFFPEDWLLLREHYALHPAARRALYSDPAPLEQVVSDEPLQPSPPSLRTPLLDNRHLSKARSTYGSAPSGPSPQFDREIPLSPATPTFQYSILSSSSDDD